MFENHVSKKLIDLPAGGIASDSRQLHNRYQIPRRSKPRVHVVLLCYCLNRREQDSSLAFRYACINANVCKECVMLIDGEKAYACTSRLREGRMTLEPLPGKALLRDLATDLVPPREKF